MTLKKSFISKLFYITLILLFTLTVIYFGVDSNEQYPLGLYSTSFFWNSSTISTFFTDFIGPGAKIPLGSGPFLHPLNFFINEIKLYYALFIFFHLIIQFEFTKKILRLFEIKYNLLILSVLLTFSLPNILYASVEDWLTPFFAYTFFPVIFYYLIKIIKYKNDLDYLKFSLFFSFWIINSHTGLIATYIVFLIIFTFLSLKNFQNFKKIFKPIFFVSLFTVLLILSELLYYLLRELVNFEGWRAAHGTYSLINFFEIFFPNEENITSTRTKFSLFRMPGNPILIYLCLYISFISFLSFIQNLKRNKKDFFSIIYFFFNKTNKDIIFKFSCLFVIFLTFSLLPILLLIPAVSSAWMARDLFLYVGIFLFFDYQKNFKKNLRLFLNILLIFYTVLYFSINIKNKLEVNQNNFIVDRVNNSDFQVSFKELNIKENDFRRIYLSPDLFPEIRNDFREEGIFSWTDFNKFNIVPFNGFFKYTSMKGFGDERNIMRGTIDSHYDLINDNFFLNIFKIDYVLATKNEIKFIKNEKLELIKTIKTKEKTLYLFRNKPLNYSINKKNLNELTDSFKNCKERKLINGNWVNEDSKLDCLLKVRNLFSISGHKLERQYNSSFDISNFDNQNFPILPFIYDKNWKVDSGSLFNGGNFLQILNTEKVKNKKISLNYFDNARYYLRILSLLSFIFLLILVLIMKVRSINIAQ